VDDDEQPRHPHAIQDYTLVDTYVGLFQLNVALGGRASIVCLEVTAGLDCEARSE